MEHNKASENCFIAATASTSSGDERTAPAQKEHRRKSPFTHVLRSECNRLWVLKKEPKQ